MSRWCLCGAHACICVGVRICACVCYVVVLSVWGAGCVCVTDACNVMYKFDVLHCDYRVFIACVHSTRWCVVCAFDGFSVWYGRL